MFRTLALAALALTFASGLAFARILDDQRSDDRTLCRYFSFVEPLACL